MSVDPRRSITTGRATAVALAAGAAHGIWHADDGGGEHGSVAAQAAGRRWHLWHRGIIRPRDE